jgi:hypothetical protein
VRRLGRIRYAVPAKRGRAWRNRRWQLSASALDDADNHISRRRPCSSMYGITAAHGRARQRSVRLSTEPSPGCRRFGRCLPSGFATSAIVIPTDQFHDRRTRHPNPAQAWDFRKPPIARHRPCCPYGDPQQISDLLECQDQRISHRPARSRSRRLAC